MIAGRVTAMGVVAALTLGCGNAQREKAVADSIAAVAATDAARAAVAADSARRDSILRTTTAERARSTGAKTTKASGTQTPTVDAKVKTGGASSTIIGRDSVRQGPIIGVPIKPDTAKKRPPR